jgi:hypothetical protein
MTTTLVKGKMQRGSHAVTGKDKQVTLDKIAGLLALSKKELIKCDCCISDFERGGAAKTATTEEHENARVCF